VQGQIKRVAGSAALKTEKTINANNSTYGAQLIAA